MEPHASSIVTAIWNGGKGLPISAPYNSDTHSQFHLTFDEEPEAFECTRRHLESTSWSQLHPWCQLDWNVIDIDMLMHVTDASPSSNSQDTPQFDSSVILFLDLPDRETERLEIESNSSIQKGLRAFPPCSVSGSSSSYSSTSVHRLREPDVSFQFNYTARPPPTTLSLKPLPESKASLNTSSRSMLRSRYIVYDKCSFKLNDVSGDEQDDAEWVKQLARLELHLTFLFCWQTTTFGDSNLILTDLVEQAGWYCEREAETNSDPVRRVKERVQGLIVEYRRYLPMIMMCWIHKRLALFVPFPQAQNQSGIIESRDYLNTVEK